jgi:hypothetical protein
MPWGIPALRRENSYGGDLAPPGVSVGWPGCLSTSDRNITTACTSCSRPGMRWGTRTRSVSLWTTMPTGTSNVD